MRWPFRRRRPTQHPETRSSARPAGSTAHGRPARRDWAHLPPLSPATAVAPLTVPARSFVAGLAATQPMMHRPGFKRAFAEAPSGMFHLAVVAGRSGPADPDAPQVADDTVPEGQALVLTPLPPPRRLRAASPSQAGRPPSAVAAPEAQLGAAAELTGPIVGEDGAVDPTTPPAVAVPTPADGGVAPAHASTVATGPTSRPSLGQARRLGLGPGYHGPLPEAIRLEHSQRPPTEAEPTAGRIDEGGVVSGSPSASPDRRRESGAGARPARRAEDQTADERLPSRRDEAPSTEAVPDEVRSELRAAYGVDVPIVHRGPEVGNEARRLGARAFARGGEVFVPDEAGPLDTPEGRSIVAHELTHAAQQRRPGGSLPAEDSPAGQILEARAQAAERHFRGEPGVPRPTPELADARPPDDDRGVDEARALMQRMVSEGFAVSDGGGGILFNQPAPPAPAPLASPAGAQRMIAPAPPASTAPTPTHWNPFETLAHDVAQDFTGFAGDITTSTFALSQDVQDEMARSRNDVERQFAVDEFRTLRLEHRKTQFLAAHHQTSLSREDERALEKEVEDEVGRRLHELESRVNHRLDLQNGQQSQSRSGGTEAVHVLDPDKYEHVVRQLFGDPDSPPPPDDTRDVSTIGHGGPTTRGATPSASETTSAATSTNAAAPGTSSASKASNPTKVTPSPHQAPAASRSGSKAAGAPTAGRPSSIGHHEKTVKEGMRDIGRSILGDAVAFATTPWGIELTDEERRQVLGPDGDTPTPAGHQPTAQRAAPAAAATTATAATATEAATEHATHETRPIGSRGAGQASFSALGHDHLDLEHLDLDELSTQLYERLRRRLRLELLVDRERSGLLTDFR